MSLVNAKCPNCGATIQIDNERTEGFCSYCGSKVKFSEAQKIMVQGTVKVDTSDELSNLYLLARRAKDSGNAENATKYYNMIAIKDPNSWEANFYTIYFRAMSCKIGEIASEAQNIAKCLRSVLHLVKSNISDLSEQDKIVSEISNRTLNLAQMLYNGAKEHYYKFSKVDGQATQSAYCFISCTQIAYTLGDVISELFNGRYNKIAVSSWIIGITFTSNSTTAYREASGRILNPQKMIAKQYVAKIKELDPKAKIPSLGNGWKGCLIIIAILVLISIISNWIS